MTIEIHEPELEVLIAQHMKTGAFRDVEEVLLHALRAAPPPRQGSQLSLVEVCAMVKGLTEDVDFSRNPSTDRPMEFV